MNKEQNIFQAVRRIAELIRQNGGRTLLVGGCVRDAILGIENKDFDLEVYGLSAEQIRQTVGAEFPLDLVGVCFGVFKVHHFDIDIALPRIENKTGAGHRGFMIETVPDLSYADAAARRDFTVNAIMRDPLTDEIIDPWNGQRDLRQKILRHVSSHFSEDPLRVLRCMQFAARFGFTVAPETIRLCAGLSQHELAQERIGEEWEKLLLKAKKPSNGLNFLRDCGWIRFYPELAALTGDSQWEYTLRISDAAAELRSGKNEFDSLVLMTAALCLGISRQPDGAKAACRFIEQIWRRNDLPEAVLPLVNAHAKPVMLAIQNAADKEYRKLALEVKRLDLLSLLAEAEIQGAEPDALRRFREKAEALHIYREPPKPILLGRHLIERGYKPGPDMGKILGQCFTAQIDGIFTDLNGGLKYLDELLKKQ